MRIHSPVGNMKQHTIAKYYFERSYPDQCGGAASLLTAMHTATNQNLTGTGFVPKKFKIIFSFFQKLPVVIFLY